MRKFEAVLFDLDGTLLDTLKDLALATNAVLERYGYPVHPVNRYRYLVGEGMEVLVKKALPVEARRQEVISSLLRELREEYGKRWADHTAPYPGVPELLDYLEKKGMPRAILSNKSQDFTELTVDALLSSWDFQVVQGLEPGVPAKPDPAGALKVAGELKVEPERIIYLGDTSIDMKTACAAGMYPVGALWGFRPAAELRDNGAEMLLKHPRDVITEKFFAAP